MKKSKLQFLYDLSINFSLSLALTYLVHVIFLYKIPLVSQEARNNDMRLDGGGTLVFVLAFILIALSCKIYTKIRKSSYLSMRYLSFILVPLILIASLVNHNGYYKEVCEMDRIYNSGDISLIKSASEKFLDNYQHQPNVEFYRLSIIKKFNKKIQDYDKAHPANSNYWESPLWPKDINSTF